MGVTVFLADLAKGVKYPSPVRSTLEQFFAKATGGEGNVKVQWTSTRPQLSKYDLLVYFVRNPDDSVLSYGMTNGSKKPASDANGWTNFGSGKAAGSEVYLSGISDDGDALARLSLHELMHNMSLTGDSMHKPGMSIGAETMKPDAALSAADIKLITAHLTKTDRVQWSDGFSAYNDPMRGGI